jgi:hypothetical protein
MKNKFFLFVISLALILQIGLGGRVIMAAPLHDPLNATYVVYPDDLHNWGFFVGSGSGTYSFMTGPLTPLLGTGSVRLQITGPADEYILYTPDWNGTNLSAITLLSYSTYQDPSSAGSDTQQPALAVNIDYDTSDSDITWQGRLVFEPYLTPDNNPVKEAWQTWNALNGLWWSTELPGSALCPQSTPCSLSTLLSNYPNAGISTGIGFKVGDGWTDGFIGNVDNFSIGKSGITTTYDFEQYGLKLASLDLWKAINPTIGPWQLLTGSYADGFKMILDPGIPYYYLDTNAISVSRPLVDGNQPFFIQSYPTGFLAYWAGRGVVSGASGWQGIMWQIINGNQPIFYLKVTGTDYMLVDGLTYLTGGGEHPYRVEGTFLPGVYIFRGTVTDVIGNTDQVNVNITFNDLPVASDQTVSTSDDTALPIVLSATDLYPGTLTWSIVAAPSHGTLTGTAPALTYTPSLNYYGTDTFTFKVDDGTAESNIATVDISVNDLPVASDQTVSTSVDTALPIVLSATDLYPGTLTWSIVAAPSHGTLTGTAPALTYTPSLNYYGSDTFTFKVNDGTVDSNIATVDISVTPINSAPLAVNNSYSVDKGTVLIVNSPGVLGNDTDPENDPLTAILNVGTSHGELHLYSNGSFFYIPDTDYSGIDTFTYHANDGALNSNITAVMITVRKDQYKINLPLINR